jgi:catechol 2,3-dioxygenase-like lactoylglutathione lyase family enzyme
MPLHRLVSMRIGVPDPDGLAAFYGEVGLEHDGTGRFASPDGGTQVIVESNSFRRLLGIELGVDDEADVAAIADRAAVHGARARTSSGAATLTDPVSRVAFTVRPADRLAQSPPTTHIDNAPGAAPRRNRRAPGVFASPRPPRRLGHVVIGTPDIAATRSFLVEAIGLKISDDIDGVISFLRCSTDHHNIALVHSPVPILQHYSWECDDVDHVGHTATALVRADPARHTWGFGRHFIGSNFYWYLADPAGSFIEMYSDMDMIDDDDEWASTGRTPTGFEHVANSWGPNIPMEFISPPDLPALQDAWAKLD